MASSKSELILSMSSTFRTVLRIVGIRYSSAATYATSDAAIAPEASSLHPSCAHLGSLGATVAHTHVARGRRQGGGSSAGAAAAAAAAGALGWHVPAAWFVGVRGAFVGVRMPASQRSLHLGVVLIVGGSNHYREARSPASMPMCHL